MIYLLENPEGYPQRDLARMLLAYGLYQEYQIRERAVIETAPLGKPYLPEYPQIHFNYSHSREGILCGIYTEEIGVDIERIIPCKERLAARVCHPNELRLLEESQDRDRMMTAIWTAKESYVKYLGTGIRSDLRQIDLSGALTEHEMVGECYLHSLIEENYGICVCCPDRHMLLKRVTLEMIKHPDTE